jgi:hypothetical protein
MAVPLLVGFVLGLVLAHHRAIVAALGVGGWVALSCWIVVVDLGSVDDGTDLPAWMVIGAAAVVLLVPYVFGLLLAMALRSPSPALSHRRSHYDS